MDEETVRLLAKRDARIDILEMRIQSLENLVGTLNNRIIELNTSITQTQQTSIETKATVAGKGGVAVGGDCHGSIVTGSGMIPKK